MSENPAERSLSLVTKVIASEFGVDASQITPATVAGDILGWDSFSHGSVILELENEIGTVLPLERTLELQTVGELAQLIEEFLN
ncbi:acyl carrier protein [Brevundimonas sp. 'scallop']|uniref:acyl carrier protein n=1 Tax=Brevundimonas sp. 'scallop' TaxID=2562582 RepID=UPI0013E1C332|nr:acyl carrier protein [Brevundimonas sp. 'scallop']QIF80621.1 acyl carrier protein [Brevundimonas sp. 'scallop']